jgi:hypothetical protein
MMPPLIGGNRINYVVVHSCFQIRADHRPYPPTPKENSAIALPSLVSHSCARLTVLVLGCAEEYLIGHIFLMITPHVHSATLDFDKLNKSLVREA